MFVKVQIEDCNTEKEAVLLENDPKVEKKLECKWKIPC